MRAQGRTNLTTKLAKIAATESSQPSYLGNPNLHRQAVWLCFYSQKGFHDFRVTTIFGKSEKSLKLEWRNLLDIKNGANG